MISPKSLYRFAVSFLILTMGDIQPLESEAAMSGEKMIVYAKEKAGTLVSGHQWFEEGRPDTLEIHSDGRWYRMKVAADELRHHNTSVSAGTLEPAAASKLFSAVQKVCEGLAISDEKMPVTDLEEKTGALALYGFGEKNIYLLQEKNAAQPGYREIADLIRQADIRLSPIGQGKQKVAASLSTVAGEGATKISSLDSAGNFNQKSGGNPGAGGWVSTEISFRMDMGKTQDIFTRLAKIVEKHKLIPSGREPQEGPDFYQNTTYALTGFGEGTIMVSPGDPASDEISGMLAFLNIGKNDWELHEQPVITPAFRVSVIRYRTNVQAAGYPVAMDGFMGLDGVAVETPYNSSDPAVKERTWRLNAKEVQALFTHIQKTVDELHEGKIPDGGEGTSSENQEGIYWVGITPFGYHPYSEEAKLVMDRMHNTSEFLKVKAALEKALKSAQ